MTARDAGGAQVEGRVPEEAHLIDPQGRAVVLVEGHALHDLAADDRVHGAQFAGDLHDRDRLRQGGGDEGGGDVGGGAHAPIVTDGGHSV